MKLIKRVVESVKNGWESVWGKIQDMKTCAAQSSEQPFSPGGLLCGVGVWRWVGSGGAEVGQRLLVGSA